MPNQSATTAKIAQKSKVFAAVISRNEDWRVAARESAAKAKNDLGGKSCDFALFFISESYPDLEPAELSKILSQLLDCSVMLGCNASGIIGENNEIEMEPGLSLLAMHLPGVKLSSFALADTEINSLQTGTDLMKLLDIYPTEKPNFLCLADPMICDVDKLLRLFNTGYPERPVIGGLASGAAVGRPSWLALDGDIKPAAAIGVALSGDVEFEVIVSQGCRPIGEPLIMTKTEGHVLHSLAGRPALEVLRDILETLPPADRALARHSLFAGLAMDEYKSNFKRGDFLIRNLIGSDPNSGALMVGAELRNGQTLQFQLRDARTSAEDLEALLKKMPGDNSTTQGALLVSCCGRGRGLYGKPNHDIAMIQSMRGPLPLAGFFANGEFGPIGGKNYVHGYTSSLAIIK